MVSDEGPDVVLEELAAILDAVNVIPDRELTMFEQQRLQSARGDVLAVMNNYEQRKRRDRREH